MTSRSLPVVVIDVAAGSAPRISKRRESTVSPAGATRARYASSPELPATYRRPP